MSYELFQILECDPAWKQGASGVPGPAQTGALVRVGQG